MRKLIPLIAAIALLVAVAPPASAAKGVPYKGKTSGGHNVTFTLRKGQLRDFVSGVPMTCLAIQGGGAPMTGVEPVGYGWVDLGLRNYKYSEQSKPSFHYNEVTRNHTVTTRRARNGTVSGAIRLQYEFLVPKYPIGTFTIYSCLGDMRFKARPAR
jgi:hypothetical protein